MPYEITMIVCAPSVIVMNTTLDIVPRKVEGVGEIYFAVQREKLKIVSSIP